MSVTSLTAGLHWWAEAPIKPATGDCYYDTTTSWVRMWNGTRWLNIGEGTDPMRAEAEAVAGRIMERHRALKKIGDRWWNCGRCGRTRSVGHVLELLEVPCD